MFCGFLLKIMLKISEKKYTYTYFNKNPQATNAFTFFTYTILAIGRLCNPIDQNRISSMFIDAKIKYRMDTEIKSSQQWL